MSQRQKHPSVWGGKTRSCHKARCRFRLNISVGAVLVMDSSRGRSLEKEANKKAGPLKHHLEKKEVPNKNMSDTLRSRIMTRKVTNLRKEIRERKKERKTIPHVHGLQALVGEKSSGKRIRIIEERCKPEIERVRRRSTFELVKKGRDREKKGRKREQKGGRKRSKTGSFR